MMKQYIIDSNVDKAKNKERQRKEGGKKEKEHLASDLS